MPFQIDYDALVKLLAPLLVALAGAWAKRRFEGKPKLVTYVVHAASNPLPLAGPPPEGQPALANAPPQAINTHAIVVRNAGRKTAHSVRIDHAFFPFSYSVFPPIHHTLARQGEGAEILIPVLVPGEQITVSYLYFPPVTWDRVNGWVKCDEGMARAVTAIPSTPPPRAVIWVLGLFTFVGASVFLYWMLQLLIPWLTR
eukprot:Opistho-1_new@22547